MKISYDKATDTFFCFCEYEEKDIPKKAGFLFDKEMKVWFSKNLFAVSMMQMHLDDFARHILQQKQEIARREYIASFAASASAEIPVPEGQCLTPFQVAGVQYALSRTNTLLGDEMGLGKTIQAIALANAIGINHALIICPNAVKLNWGRELRRWLTRDLTWGVAHARYFPKLADIIIINYDIIHKYERELRKIVWDLLIIDEAHYIKNPGTRRSQYVYGAKGVSPLQAKRKLLLTGTPIDNRPKEIFPLAHYLDTESFPAFFNFAKRYCGGPKPGGGWHFDGASNLEELRFKLRSTIMVRRLKSEVLSELPPKRRQIIELPNEDCRELIEQEKEAYESRIGVVYGLKSAVLKAKEANDTAAYKQAVSKLREGQGRVLSEIATLRRKVALAKLPYVFSHIQNCLEQEDKICVFAHHREVCEKIVEKFHDEAVLYYGGMTIEAKDAAIVDFQESRSCRIFVGSIKAAGVGINLTAASHAICVELDWVPSTMLQLEDRLHRMGQRDSVFIQHMVLEDSLDARIAKTLIEKQEVIEKALNR